MAKCYEIDGLVPVVDPSAFVHPEAVLIGDAVVGAGCYVGPGAVMRGDMGRVELRAGANLQDHCIMHSFPSADCVVDVDGHIGHGAVLHGCTIERGALVGMNAVIMDDAVVGEAAFVAAGACVTAKMQVPARTLAAGVPAKIIRDLTDQEVDWKHQGTLEYQELARRCFASLRAVEPLAEAEADRPRLNVSQVKPLKQERDG